MVVEYNGNNYTIDKLVTSTRGIYGKHAQELILGEHLDIPFTLDERYNLFNFIDKVNDTEEKKGDLDSKLIVEYSKLNMVFTISYILGDEAKYKICTDINWLRI